MKDIYILDGSGYLFRAYYALPEIKDKEGNIAQAIFGFFKMIFSLLKNKPDHFIITRDSPKETIRQQNFAQYKINRPPIPDNFKQQALKIKEFSKKIGLNTIEIAGYEADDIIYNLVKKWTNNTNFTLYLITSDKDLKQLLGPNIFIKDPMKNQTISEADFIKQYGFKPKYIVDFLALTGDSSDNIPGVKGIGQKTAQKLIQQYQTIENIYQNIDNIPEKIKKLLLENKEKALMSKNLIQLMDIPNFNISLENLNKQINIQQAKSLFIDKLGFTSFEKILNQLKQTNNKKQQLTLF